MTETDTILPFRRRHAPLAPGGELKDSQGRPSRPAARVLDPLDALVARGGLAADSAAYLAGDRFRRDFALAALDRLSASDPGRLPGRRGAGVFAATGLTDSTLGARDRLRAAITALGGQGAGPGRIAWWVLGMGAGLRHFASADLPGLPPPEVHPRMDPRQAAGLLMAALDVLAGHYRRVDRHGLPRRRPAEYRPPA